MVAVSNFGEHNTVNTTDCKGSTNIIQFPYPNRVVTIIMGSTSSYVGEGLTPVPKIGSRSHSLRVARDESYFLTGSQAVEARLQYSRKFLNREQDSS